MAIANAIVIGLAAYSLAGLVFATIFVITGIGKVDPIARGSSIGFRLIVVPGAAALWPLLLQRWLRVSKGDLQ